MVAVVTGTGLGLAGSSAAVLGVGGQLGAAATGRGGEAVYVNAQTGALIVQHQDELLVGQGPDIGVVRTYNSNATFDFDNNDAWQLSLYKKLGALTGTVNTAGSTITRTGADGAQLTYTYDATQGQYINTNGAGAYATLAYDGAADAWTWTDGDSQVRETYTASPTAGEWRISGQADLDGNALTYAYDGAGLIARITDANGEATQLTYDAATRRLQSLQVVTADGVTTTRIRYTYDSAGRLSSVVTDLTPADGSIADGATYTTTYTYDGTSQRIASIVNSDGTRVSFIYDASQRIQTVTDGAGQTTTFAYGSGTTTVTDPLGQASTLTYDAAGNLTRLQGPAGSGQDVRYAYNGNGDLIQLTDSRGNTVTSAYDAHGNLIRQQDAAGNVVERAYNGANQLVSETVYAVPDPDGAGPAQASVPQTTYYIRDAQQHLRFTVSPQGRVTEYRYNAQGQQTASLTYTQSINPSLLASWSQDFSVDASGLMPTTLPAGFALANGALQVTSTNQATAAMPMLRQMTVSIWGSTWRAEVTTPATLTPKMLDIGLGSGITGPGPNASFDGGNIIANTYACTPAGPQTLGTAKPNTTYVVEVVTTPSLSMTLYVYEKGKTRADGYSFQTQTTNTLNKGSSLMIRTTNGPTAGDGTLGSTTTITVDNLSVQVPQADALAGWASRTSALGCVAERTDTAYDARGLATRVTRYAQIDTTGAGIADGSQTTTQYVYDSAGRLLQQIDPRGVATAGVANDYVTSYAYDGLGRQISVTATDAAGSAARQTLTTYNDAAHRIELTLANGLKRVSTFDARGLLVSQADQDGASTLSTQTWQYDADGRLCIATDPNGNKTYSCYDAAGRLVGVIDPNGGLTETVYNAAGQVIKTIRYSTPVSANLATLFAPNAQGVIPDVALSSLRPASVPNFDPVERRIYDAAGRLRFIVDGRNFVTETRYDGAGRVLTTLAYANALNNPAGLDGLGREAQPADLQLLTAAPSGSQIGLLLDSANDRVTRYFYDADGLLAGTLDGEGYLTQYTYDAAGRLTQTTRCATPTNAADRAAGTLATLVASANATPVANIVSHVWYNGLGQVVGEVDGEGYYTAYQYDAAGNRTGTTRYANRPVNAWGTTAPTVVASVPATLPAGGYVLASAQDQTTQATWTAFNQIESETAVNGTVTRYTYNALGNRVSAVSAAGTMDARTLTNRYDKQGRLVQALSAAGAQALAALGANPSAAQVEAVWAAYGTAYTYDAAGRRTKQVDANGNITLYFYDAANHLTYTVVRVKNPANANEWVGEVSAAQYNALGQLATAIGYANRIAADQFATLTGGADTQITAAGVLVADAARDSRTDYIYRPTGQLGRVDVQLNASDKSSTIDGLNAFGQVGTSTTVLDTTRTRQEQYTYDRRGLVLQHQLDQVWASNPNATGVVTSATYDAFGRMVSSTDANGNVSTAAYDKLGRQIQTVTAAGSLNLTRSTTYDAFGRVLTQTDALGKVTTTAYAIDSASGQTTVTVTSPEGIVTRTVTNRYGQTVAVADGLGNETRYAYDADGNLTSIKRWDKAANAETLVEADTYDAAGHRLTTVDANGTTVAYTYDAAGRVLTRTVDPNGLKLVTTTAYDAQGRAITVTDPNGTVTQTTYDLAGRVTDIAVDPSGLNLRTHYTYDLTGHQIAVTEGYGTAAARTTAYAYDSLGRRIQATVDPGGLNLVTTYAYDAAGNLVTKIEAAGSGLDRTTRYAYDAANRLVYTVDTLGGVVQLDYDADGRVLQRTAYANPVSLANLAAAPSLAAIAALVVADPARDRTTRHVYDNDGRERFTIDALGAVTEAQYDAAGNVVRRIAYASPLQGTLALGAMPAIVATAPATGAYVLTSANDRTTTYAYDAAGRLTGRTEAAGTAVARTEGWGYDAAGHLLRHTDARGNAEWFAYDAAGRLVRHIDQGGYVTDTVWNADGTKRSEKRYANAVALPAAADDRWAYAGHAANPVANADAVSGDRSRSYTYDAAGRTLTATDPLGTVTRYAYDVLGQNTDTTVADGTAQAVTLHRVYDALGRVVAETRAYGKAEASTTTYAYDALGDQTAIVEASGTSVARTTRQEFDRLGRKTAAVDGNGARTVTTYNAFGDIVKVTDALGHAGYFYTDAQGRVTLQVDPEGAVTATQYDAFGDTVGVVRYANKVVGAVSETTRPQILAAAGTGVYVVQSAADQVQQATYDALGHKTEIRTWWGPNAGDYYREAFTYDAHGNVLTATARNGAVTAYTYDALDRKVREVLPVTSKNAGGVATAVENRFAYDAFGNQVQKTEAWGLPEQRITTYTYDALDRQVKIVGENLTTFDPVSQSDVVVTPTQQRTYDARGNLIEEIDVRGGRTLHYYDAQDREIGRIDAAGAYTAWTYDAVGNKTSQTAYANTVAIAGSATLTPAGAPLVLSAAPLAGNNAVYVLLDAANDRTVYYTYDGAGRPTGTRIDNMTIGAYNASVGGGQYQVSTGSLTTGTAYDALGNVVKSVDGNGNVTRSYYNQAGQKVGQLDAKGYLVVWARDAYGNVAQETKYANAVNSSLTVTDATPLSTLVANVTASADDRVTVYAYDRLNRVLSETKKAIASGTVNATNGVLTEATQDAVTTYVYDGLNHVTQKTDAAGAVSNWTFDALGRQTEEQKPGYADNLGRTVRPTTDTEYDGLGHVRRTLVRGTDNTTEADDRITTYAYGTGGFLVSQTDANGAVTQFRIDAAGNVTKKTLVGRLNADGVSTSDATLFSYDALNRQVKSTDAATGATQETRYDAFGEITGKRTNGGGADVAWPEFAQYDRAGRAWKSNSGDGVTKVYVYDAAGNATLTVQSTGTDLTGQDLATVLQRSDTLKTISVFDARNQLTDSFAPTMDAVHQFAAVAANTTGQAVFVANNSAITIGADASVGNTTAATTNPVSAGTVGVDGGGNLDSGMMSFSISYSTAAYTSGGSGKFDYCLTTPLSQLAAQVRGLGSGNFVVRLKITPYAGDPYYGTKSYLSPLESTATYPQDYAAQRIWLSCQFDYYGNPLGGFDCGVAIEKVTSLGNVVVYSAQSSVRLGPEGWRQNGNGEYSDGSMTWGFDSITVPNVCFPSARVPTRLDICNQPPSTSRVLLAYRPAGSTAPYALVNVPQMFNTAGAAMAGWFALDWAAAGLSGGNYDFQYVAFDGTGAVVNQQSGNLNLTNPAAPAMTQYNGALGGIGGAGRGLLDSSGNLHIIEPSNVTGLTLRYRVKGSGSAWSVLGLVPSNPIGIPTKGWFYFPYANYLPAGATYEFDLTAYSGASVVVSRAKGEFSRPASGNPSISAFTAYSQLPSIVHLTERADTQYVTVSYRPNGSTGGYTTVQINPTAAGSGRFDWDATALVPDVLTNYDYDVVVKAYSAGDLINNQTNAVLRLGASPTVVSANTQSLAPVLRVTPSQTGVARIALGYRLKGSNGAYTPLTMTAVGGEFRNDLSSLPPAVGGAVDYEYVYDAYDSAGTLLGRDTGTFSLPPQCLVLATASGGVSILGNSVTKTSGVNGNWDADAYSPTSLTGNAYVSAQVGQTNLSGMFGLNGDPTTDRSYTSLDYAWSAMADGTLAIYENGTAIGSFGTYKTTDVLSIAYADTTVSYLKNGQVIRTVATTANRTFYFDSSFCHLGFTLNAVQFSRAPTFASRGNLLLNGKNATKTGADGWDADAYSLVGYTGGAYVSAQAGQTNLYGMFGLNADPTTDSSYASLDYAWYIGPSGGLYIYESNVFIGNVGSYTTSDVLSIVYSGTTVTYLKNGQVMRSVATTAGQTFYFDSSFYSAGFSFNNIQFGTPFIATGGGVAINGNSVIKTASTAWGNADAYSLTGLVGSAYVSAKAGQINMGGMFGLNADPTTDLSYTSLDYAWFCAANGNLCIYESGVYVGTFGTYTTSDVLSVVYAGNTVSYLKNGQVVRTVSTTTGRTFYFDSSFNETGFTLNAIQFGTPLGASTAGVTINGDPYNLNGNSLTKTGGSTNAWDSDAYSLVGYTGGAYVSAQAGQTNLHGMFGLNSDPTTDRSYTSLDYAWYPAADGNLYIYESGVGQGNYGPYTTSDVLTVVYDGSAVRYLKNGQVMRSVATTAGQTFYFDSSFYSAGFSFNNIQFGSSVLSTVTTGGGAAINGNTISKSSGTSTLWDANVYSQSSYTGNASASAKAGQTNKTGMFGLSAAPTAQSNASLDYAWCTRSDGALLIYEGGTAVGTFGTYTTSDDLSIAYSGTTVSYLKNGQVMRTVTTTAGRTFYFNSSFLDVGCTLNAIQFGATSSQSTRLDWVIQNVSTVSSRVHKQQATNAFGEVVQEIDGLGRVTDLAYNTAGQLVKKQDPETDVTLANGYTQRARPTTRYVYDLAGRLIGTVDPNGSVNTQVWLNGGTQNQVVLERHADGGLVSHAYDIFGDKRVDIDALGQRTDTAYDSLDHVVEVRHPQRANGTQAVDRYGYDAAGNRITHTNAVGDVEKTFYDSLGRVTQTRSYAGFATTYSYVYVNAILGVGGLMVGGWQKTTTDAVGRTLIDRQDLFGHTTWHQDLGGHQFTYGYNGAGWLVSQTGSTGQNIATDYYANGYVKSVWDKTTGAYTRYEYDNAGNRTFEGYVYLTNPADLNGGVRDYYEYATLDYDELNRLKRVFDPKAEIKYEYDAAGNRRRVVSTYHDGVNGAMRTQDYWYAYDAMNRFTVTMGALSTGARGSSAADTSVSIVKGSTGVAIAYDLGGNRRQAQNGADGTVEDYSYSADGYLEDVKINGTLRSRRVEDLLGRVGTYTEWAANGSVAYQRTSTYDKDSRELSQSIIDNSGPSLTTSTVTDLYYTDATGNTDNAATASAGGAGQLARTTSVSTSNGSTTTVTSYYAYDYWDTAQQKAITAQAYNPNVGDANAQWKPGYSKQVYDVNGHLTLAVDAGSDGVMGTADDRILRYTTDAQGLVLVRDEIAGGSVDASHLVPRVYGGQVNKVQRYYYANGVRVGDVGNDGPSRTDYAQAIAARGVDHKDYKNWKPVAAADFDQNYEPVGANYPGMTASSYTVRAGDTLQSIARAVWGDSAQWYLIADANGLTGTDALKAGQVLTLPNKVTNVHNNAGTFRPYNPGEAIGDTSPTIPDAPPPPASDGPCGGFGGVIVMIVTVVVAVFAPYLIPALGPAALGPLGSAMACAAVGNIAGQAVGNAIGVQHGFSWSSLATSVISAGITEGLVGGTPYAQAGPNGIEITATPMSGPLGQAFGQLPRYAQIAARAITQSAISQGVGTLTGQQSKFSWSGVAAAGISAVAGQYLSNSVLGSGGPAGDWAQNNRLGASLLDSGIRALTSAVTRVEVVGGHLSWAAVAGDTLASYWTSPGTWGSAPSIVQDTSHFTVMSNGNVQAAPAAVNANSTGSNTDDILARLGTPEEFANDVQNEKYGPLLAARDGIKRYRGMVITANRNNPSDQSVTLLDNDFTFNENGMTDGAQPSPAVDTGRQSLTASTPTGLLAFGSALENKFVGLCTGGESLLGDIGGTIENLLASALLPAPASGGEAPVPAPGAADRLIEKVITSPALAIENKLGNDAGQTLNWASRLLPKPASGGDVPVPYPDASYLNGTLGSLFVKPFVDSYHAFNSGDQVAGYGHAIDGVISVGSVVVPALRAGGRAEAAVASKTAPLTQIELEAFRPIQGGAFEALPVAERRAFLENYAKQVAGQESAINKLTVNEYLSARESYRTAGRNPLAQAEQSKFAKDFEARVRTNIYESLIADGVSAREARALSSQRAAEIRSQLAALHEPDMVAGGWTSPTPTRMGNASVNSSIGASWKTRLPMLDAWAADAAKSGYGSANMNVKLRILGW